MPRQARKKSESGLYHIMFRGTNRQEIFHDDEDCLRFLETVYRYKRKSKIKVHGWCLMNNHVHLLLQEGNEEISDTMKRIGISFVSFYNWKYGTTGHLFQDRFMSEAVENNNYLATVIRYIHQNPVKAGIVERAADWKWSSYIEYCGGNSCLSGLLDSELILSLFAKERVKAVARFKEFNETENTDCCLDNDRIMRLTDEEAKKRIAVLATGVGITEIKNLPKTQRNKILIEIKKIEGVSYRQTARILGISPKLVHSAK